MPITRPYRRTCRVFWDGHYAEGGRWRYIQHPRFAQTPGHYIRAFLLLLKDLQELFDYVEPAARNLACYSFRIHALLLRACIEVEANCKAILRENQYTKDPRWWTMADYRKINRTHRLSSYRVKLPHWTGAGDVRTPFAAWATPEERLPWYVAYNTAKHDRLAEFEQATFEHLLDACCGVLVILSAQFWTRDFSPTDDHLTFTVGGGDGMESGIGGYFRVGFPNDWPVEERYAFDWEALLGDADPFQTIDYDAIP
jgi:hypothetical protein